MSIFLYKDKKQRFDFINKLSKSIEWKDRQICIIGNGCMGKLILYWINYIFNNPNITVIDKNEDKLSFAKKYFKKVKCINKTITKLNYLEILNFLKKGDLLIDASYDIYTNDIYRLCNNKGFLYINSAVESWSYKNIKNPYKYSLHYRTSTLIKLNQKSKNNTNFIVSMGCNPGNVSMWTKLGLLMLGKKNKIQEDISFAEMANKLGIEVIHISEHDSQLIDKPRKKDEYCNTWSGDPDSFYQEAFGPVEFSFGTHEKNIPKNTVYHSNESDRVVILKDMGIQKIMRSYTPKSLMFHGMMIRHEENLTIGKYLSIKSDKNQIIYQPSVYYVYKPTNALLTDVLEVREQKDKYSKKYRLLTNEIIEGSDELGVSIFLKNGEVYWIGSLLDINEARELHPKWMNEYINATNVQVLGGYLTGILYLIDLDKNGIKQGLIFPEDIPLEYLNINLAFQGEFVFQKAKWDFEKSSSSFGEKRKQKNWSFQEFEA